MSFERLPSDHVSNPENLASLALTLMQAGAWEPLSAISSIFIKERVEVLDSHSVSEKLPLFCWNSQAQSATRQSEASRSDSPSEQALSKHEADIRLMELWDLINQFEPKETRLRTFYRVWDEETTQAAVKFSLSRDDGMSGSSSPMEKLTPPPSPPRNSNADSSSMSPQVESNLSGPIKGGVIILLQNGANAWTYHDIKAVRDWDHEFPSDWHNTLHEARDHFQRSEKDRAAMPVSDADDGEYWSTYDSVHIKGVPPSAKNAFVEEEESRQAEDSDGDYWDDYSANLPSY
ncbi:hypothetical protein HDU67_008796 [Dinochytrium kinnereticum]|nr:hypothetical protein HDU67_008796 [Dinochytrium kinnereticum]